MNRPRRLVAMVALLLACAAHALFADWSLGLRPKKVKPKPIQMVVQAPADDPLPAEAAADPSSSGGPPGSHAHVAAPSARAEGGRAPPTAPPVPFGLEAGLAGIGSGASTGFGAVGSGPGSTQAGSEPRASAADTPESPQVTAPRPLRRPAPEYPRRARAEKVEGVVVLLLLVDVDGSVRDVRVLDAQPPGVFDDAAVAAVRRWSFTPGERAGQPTAAWMRQTLRFTLSSS